MDCLFALEVPRRVWVKIVDRLGILHMEEWAGGVIYLFDQAHMRETWEVGKGSGSTIWFDTTIVSVGLDGRAVAIPIDGFINPRTNYLAKEMIQNGLVNIGGSVAANWGAAREKLRNGAPLTGFDFSGIYEANPRNLKILSTFHAGFVSFYYVVAGEPCGGVYVVARSIVSNEAMVITPNCYFKDYVKDYRDRLLSGCLDSQCAGQNCLGQIEGLKVAV